MAEAPETHSLSTMYSRAANRPESGGNVTRFAPHTALDTLPLDNVRDELIITAAVFALPAVSALPRLITWRLIDV